MASSAVAGPIDPANIEIQITGLNLTYDGTNLFDSRVSNTARGGDPAEADRLASMTLLVDGDVIGTVLTQDIWADVYIKDVLNIPVGGGLIMTGGNGGAFGVDLFTKNAMPGWGLALDIDQFQLFYAGGEITIATTGVVSEVFAQDLPFGVELFENERVAIVLSSSNLSNVTDDGEFLTGLNVLGSGTFSGTGIPEPTTLALLGVGLVAVVTRRRR